ncbi:hypothetical protein [Schinkia azotoformans]|uniref:hypothetical protein n=1 Tax=Schinkia azotoformans TaxID=1454 RepID=UPI002DB59393|nr:hypothetical protein [Schinkia azotoformans]MEC1698243.1 hypothetical protein [Schinkia azotoformans]MEC1718595.1 hypothetical protein [Schinkia azotoformans]MEC1758785.1 hypothetical protein [Schinkia azotoformans]
MNFIDADYYRNKIHRHFNLIDKNNNKEFLPSLAIFFDFLCEDPIITSMLSQILNQSNKPEEYIKECVKDLSNLLNMFILECASKIKQLGKWEELIKFERCDFQKVKNDTDYMLPLAVIMMEEDNLAKVEKELYTSDNYYLVVSKFKGLENVVSQFNLNVEEITHTIELNYEDWKKPSSGYINLRMLHFENNLTREELEERLIFDSAFEKLKRMIDILRESYRSIEILSFKNTKVDLLEIISYLNYNFPYLTHVKKLVENNPSIIKYGRKDFRMLIVEKSMVLENFSYIEWEQKLNRILTQLYTLIDSTWYIGALLDKYHIKIRDYGWTRLARLSKEQSLPMNEKFFQFDLAEYLFDHGITTVVEKVAGNDRLDIVTLDQNSTIIEVKLFRELKNLTDIFQGLTQTLKYTQSHGKTSGYYVVFQSSEDHCLELVKEFTIGGVTIFLLLIDITGINGRGDSRERINLNDEEFRNFITFKDKSFTKDWNNLTISDLLLIDGIGPATALKLIAKKYEVRNWNDLKEIKIESKLIEQLEKHFQF